MVLAKLSGGRDYHQGVSRPPRSSQCLPGDRHTRHRVWRVGTNRKDNHHHNHHHHHHQEREQEQEHNRNKNKNKKITRKEQEKNKKRTTRTRTTTTTKKKKFPVVARLLVVFPPLASGSGSEDPLGHPLDLGHKELLRGKQQDPGVAGRRQLKLPKKI